MWRFTSKCFREGDDSIKKETKTRTRNRENNWMETCLKVTKEKKNEQKYEGHEKRGELRWNTPLEGGIKAHQPKISGDAWALGSR